MNMQVKKTNYIYITVPTPGADPGFATRGGCPNLGGSGGMPPQENFEKFTPLKGNFKAFQVKICLS